MNELQQERFEQQLLSISKGMEYPRTPDIAGSVMRRVRQFPSPRGRLRSAPLGGGVRGEGRRLAWALTVLLVLCSSLMLIPPARAAILEFIEIGVVRIFRTEPTPIATPEQPPSTPVPPTPTSTPQAFIPLLEDIAGEVTLEGAQRIVEYPVLVPSYPPDLGPPDRVFVQDAEGYVTILVWIDPQDRDEVLMSLHFLPAGSWAVDKFQPTIVQETTVDGRRAAWTVGPYPLRFRDGNLDFTRMVDGHVLIWAEGEITYRLETRLSMEEAVRVAESLQPVP